MLLVVIGITYGTSIGVLGNWLVFRKMAENSRAGVEPLKGVGAIFFLRYAMDAAFLFGFGYVVKDVWAIIAAAMSLTIAIKVSLLIVYTKKGGRFD